MMVSEAMMAMKPMVPTKPVRAPPRLSCPRAGHEQHRQHHDKPHPRRWAASALMSLSHGVSPPRLPACVLWKTPLLTMWRDRSTDRRAEQAPLTLSGRLAPWSPSLSSSTASGPAVVTARGTSPPGIRRRGAASQRQRSAMGDETGRLGQHAQYTTHLGTSHTRCHGPLHRLRARRRLRLLVGGSSGLHHAARSCGERPPRDRPR